MDNANKGRCLDISVRFAERRALDAHSRYRWARDNAREAGRQGKNDLRRVYTLEAWRARQALDVARDDRRAALKRVYAQGVASEKA